MTGTPIENRLSDLWLLFDFLDAGLLGNAKEFTNFTKRIRENNSDYAKLRNIVNPFILRRLKTDKSVITDLPEKIEIKFKCSCPDSARMCKHVAAVLYGIGARLDEDPILFFKLRCIDFQKLLKKSMEDKMQSMLKNADKKSDRVIDDAEIFDLFGV